MAKIPKSPSASGLTRTANVLCWLLVGALPALASSAEPAPAPLDTVTVQASSQRETLERRVGSFVSAIAAHAGGESLARWQVPVCPVVLGLPREQNEFVQARLANVAREAGLSVKDQPCGGNFLVVLTGEPEKLLREWFERYPRLFNDERGVGGIKRFIENGPAVRAWYNACSQAPGSSNRTMSTAGLQCNTGRIGSRLAHETVRVLYSVIVVVDLRRIDGVKFGQLSDYIAMTGLVQLREPLDVGDAPTILTLLNASVDAKPDGLSSWDRAFLRSLYATNSASVAQMSVIRQEMMKDVGP